MGIVAEFARYKATITNGSYPDSADTFTKIHGESKARPHPLPGSIGIEHSIGKILKPRSMLIRQ